MKDLLYRLNENPMHAQSHNSGSLQGALVPFVIEKSGREERAMDIFSRLLRDRIIFLGSAIDDTVANLMVAQMLFLHHEDSKKEISLYINSPGGSVSAGMAIYDTMQFLTCGVATYCVGQAASMGAVLLAAGKAGRRHSLPLVAFRRKVIDFTMELTADSCLLYTSPSPRD